MADTLSNGSLIGALFAALVSRFGQDGLALIILTVSTVMGGIAWFMRAKAR